MPNQLHSSAPLDLPDLASVQLQKIVNVIRRLRGGSQAKLVRGDDGYLYILKCLPNPQGPNVLANEWIGSVIINGLGIESAVPRQLFLERAELDAFPLLAIDLGDRHVMPTLGLQFGSRLAGSESGPSCPQDYKPKNVESLSVNHLDFLKIRLVDLWANMQDMRQFVVVPSVEGRTVTSHFIDHGHMFGGPSWEAADSTKCERLSSLQMLGGIGWPPEVTHHFIDVMENEIPGLLSLALSTVPVNWYQGDLKRFEAVQLHRLRQFRSHLSSYLRVAPLNKSFEQHRQAAV